MFDIGLFFCSLFSPCLVCVMRSAVGLAYGDPRFKEISEPYWSRGGGTTCAVTLTWALTKCGIKGLNRGDKWIPGEHMKPILLWAKKHNLIIDSPPIATLRQGDIFYLEGDTPEDWHVGVVETNSYPQKIVTLDGGQTDNRGEQSINRVQRAIVGDKLGPSPRRVKFVIRPL